MFGVLQSFTSQYVLSLDHLSEYRIQHGAIGSLYVTSSYSTLIFCRGVSGFATDCPCVVWCRGLTTCFLHVDSPFVNWFLNNNWAVDSISYFSYFDICNYICLDTSYHCLALSLLLKYSLFSSTPVLTYSIDVVFILFYGKCSVVNFNPVLYGTSVLKRTGFTRQTATFIFMDIESFQFHIVK